MTTCDVPDLLCSGAGPADRRVSIAWMIPGMAGSDGSVERERRTSDDGGN